MSLEQASRADRSAARLGNNLNSQQLDAVQTPADQPLQILAGAGTGKTELISWRFVKLVQDWRAQGVAHPEDRILVVTFTNDAAQNMHRRIHQRLGEHVGGGLGEMAWVGTFHQFALRLLRAHPLEAGLPPNFSILNTLDQHVLFNRLFQGVLEGDYTDIGPVLRQFGLHDLIASDQLSLSRLEEDMTDALHRLLDVDVLHGLIGQIKTTGLSPREFVMQAQAQSNTLTKHLRDMQVPPVEPGKPLDYITHAIGFWQDSLRDWADPGWDPVAQVEEKARQSAVKAGKDPTAGDYKKQVDALARHYLQPRSYAPGDAPETAPLDEALGQEAKAIAWVGAIYALYQHALLNQGVCDFDDLMNHLIQLLERHPELKARYQQYFLNLIVDEFQDSNGSQLRLLELLMQPGARNLTVVGDEKQSIYAFRFAQPENLDLIFRNSACRQLSLQTNYRSFSPILQVANQITSQITRKPHQHLNPSPEHAAREESPPVRWVNIQGKSIERDMDGQKELEARYIAVEIARLVQSGAYRFSDIAILVKSHRKAEQIQAALNLLNIPSLRQKNLGFFQEPVILDAMAMLGLMRNRYDERALTRLLQNKLNQRQLRELFRLKRQKSEQGAALSLFDLCASLAEEPAELSHWPDVLRLAVSDLAHQLADVQRMKSRLSPAQLFLQLARRIGLIHSHASAWVQTQQRLSLGTLERMLHLFGQSRPLRPTLEEVLDVLEQYANRPNEELPVSQVATRENAVQIMTFYKAKGLEFPVVFAAYTQLKRSGGHPAPFCFDPQYPGKAGFGLMLTRVDQDTAALKSSVHKLCWRDLREQKEALRVFYVAVTRARERLYIVRSEQSEPWTDPQLYAGLDSSVQVVAEAESPDLFSDLYDGLDDEALRVAMQQAIDGQALQGQAV